MELREIIARAAYGLESDAPRPFHTLPDWDEISEGCRHQCLARADSIISAIRKDYAIVPREPTKEMIQIGNAISSDAGAIWQPSDGIDFDGPDCGFEVWQAMLEAGEIKGE